MDTRLEQRAAALIQAYRDEIDFWEAIPYRVVRSRERLARLIQCEAPCLIIERELDLLRQRLATLRASRTPRDRMLLDDCTLH